MLLIAPIVGQMPFQFFRPESKLVIRAARAPWILKTGVDNFFDFLKNRLKVFGREFW